MCRNFLEAFGNVRRKLDSPMHKEMWWVWVLFALGWVLVFTVILLLNMNSKSDPSMRSPDQIRNASRNAASQNASQNAFDIVVLVGPNERHIIPDQVAHARRNILGYRNVYLLSYSPDVEVDGCITIHEAIFPFQKSNMPACIPEARRGWYLQQLLKLYAGQVIPGILPTYLVLDSDTYVLKPTRFVDENDVCLYATGTEFHSPYFNHMARLHPSLKRINPKESGICHHMMFRKDGLDGLFALVRSRHPDEEFWQSFLNCVDPNEADPSGASEYETYFSYLQMYAPNTMRIRPLKWSNVSSLDEVRGQDYDYVSNHWYIRS